MTERRRHAFALDEVDAEIDTGRQQRLFPAAVDRLFLVDEGWQYLDQAAEKQVAGGQQEYSGMTVVSAPIRKVRVPLNSLPPAP